MLTICYFFIGLLNEKKKTNKKTPILYGQVEIVIYISKVFRFIVYV